MWEGMSWEGKTRLCPGFVSVAVTKHPIEVTSGRTSSCQLTVPATVCPRGGVTVAEGRQLVTCTDRRGERMSAHTLVLNSLHSQSSGSPTVAMLTLTLAGSSHFR